MNTNKTEPLISKSIFTYYLKMSTVNSNPRQNKPKQNFSHWEREAVVMRLCYI